MDDAVRLRRVACSMSVANRLVVQDVVFKKHDLLFVFKDIAYLAIKIFSEFIEHVKIYPFRPLVIQQGNSIPVNAEVFRRISDLQFPFPHQ